MPGKALNILKCDIASASAVALTNQLAGRSDIATLAKAESIEDAQERLRDSTIDTVIIDPFAYGYARSSEFIFASRSSYPDIVFVLHMDISVAGDLGDFYSGQRIRFHHYFKLDKRTPEAELASEVDAVVQNCQIYLAEARERSVIGSALTHAQEIVRLQDDDESVAFADELTQAQQIVRRESDSHILAPLVRPKTVFLSYRFLEREYVEGLTELLEASGFEVVTGQATAEYVSTAVLKRIRECKYFVCLLTRVHAITDGDATGEYTTSAWVIEEKGAAIAFGKPLFLLIEDGVKDIGGLHGDWQRITFTTKGFAMAAARVLKELKKFDAADDDFG